MTILLNNKEIKKKMKILIINFKIIVKAINELYCIIAYTFKVTI